MLIRRKRRQDGQESEEVAAWLKEVCAWQQSATFHGVEQAAMLVDSAPAEWTGSDTR